MLKTKCKGCCWQKIDESKLYDKQPFCTLGHETVFDEFLQLEGFCKYKRQTNNDLAMIEEQESTLTAVIDLTEEVSMDTFKAYKALGCNEIVVYTGAGNMDPTYLHDVRQCLTDLNFNNWDVTNRFSEEVNFSLIYIFQGMKTNWFIFANNNKIINLDLINAFKKNDNVNTVAILDEKNNQFITSMFAYYQLMSGQERGFIEVLKKFDNWRDVCITI